MTLCPNDVQLQGLLAGSLGPADSALLGPHIAACPQCQARLDVLTDDTDLGRRSTSWNGPPERALEGLLKRLGQQPPPSADAAVAVLRFPGPVTPDAPGGQLGRYQIMRQLGSGAGGLLFQARDSRLGRLVAIKVLRPELAALASARARFEREARAAAALQHEHLVRVHAAASPPDFPPYLVMELIDGESLADRLEREGKLSPPLAARLVLEAALGLDAAHRQGLVHRDVKPSNILLEQATGRAKVTDFGLAVDLRLSTLTHDGQILGTPSYMSPEQAAGRSHEADARSDVYSLGAVLYHLLTGRPPFVGEARSILYQAVHQEPVPLRRLLPRIARDLETVTLQCLAKDPRRRYATAAELASDLQRWLRGEPVLARPIGRGERLLRWCRRSPVTAGLAATAGALLIVAAVAGTVAAVQHGHKKDAVADVEQRDQEIARRDRLIAQREKLLVLQRQGQDHLDWGDLEKAQAAFRTALPIAEELARYDAGNLQAKRDLALVHERLGDVSDELDEVPAARTHYTRWLALIREVVQADPRDEKARWDLCLACACLGDMLECDGETRAAEELFRECDALLGELAKAAPNAEEAASVLLFRADILADRGRHAEVAALAEQIRRRAPKDAQNLVDVAGCLAQAYRAVAPRRPANRLNAAEKALQKQYADRAVEALRAAIAAGLDDVNALQKDPYLKPLRQHPEVRKLVNSSRQS